MEDRVPFERPIWTLFFDGTLFKRYQDYLRSHDLTKILSNRASVVTNNSVPSEPPVLNDETDWLPPFNSKAMETNGGPAMSHMTSPNSENFLTKVEKKRRNRRTTGCVVMGILCLGAIAAAVALIIHFVFVKSKDQVSNSAPIRIPGSDTHHRNLSGLVNDTFTRRIVITTHSPRKDMDLDLNSPSLRNIKNMFKQKVMASGAANNVHSSFNIAQSIEMRDVSVTIGSKGLFSCNVNGISGWKSVFLRGSSKTKPDGPFEFIVTDSGDLSLKGNNSNMVIRHKLQKNKRDQTLDDVLIYIAFENVGCETQDTYTCGVQANGETDKTEAKVIVEAKPSTEVNLKIPIQVIEGERLRISATWMAGYPEPYGNLTWSKTDPGETTATDIFPEAKTSWTLKRLADKCETVIDSFTDFKLELKWNGTEIIAKPEITKISEKGPEINVSPATETLYVVPADYCDGFSNDTRTSHPYTCTKFIRCMPEKMIVYTCPGDTCFREESKQCD